MNHIFRILAIILLLIPFASAQENFNEYQDLNLILYLGSNISIKETGNDPKIDYIITDVLLFPRDEERLKILEMDAFAEPNASISLNHKATFRWDKVKEKYLRFGIKSKLNVKNDIAKIKTKVDFPLKDPVFKEYLEFTKFIDIDEDIYTKAHELVEGEDDLYFAVFKIAEWTRNNIKYDLSTMTEKAIQKSTWVFKNKVGVCDELTNLFISMLRSVGIPARFVSGTVYNNVINNWGGHGWAEVYFPNYGWVPFDVTFGQYGWVDASHLKLSDTADSGESSLEYNWRSRDIDLIIEDVTLNTSLEKAGDKIKNIIELEINTLENDRFGFGSYVPIEVKITNLRDHYLSTSIILTKAPKLIEKNTKIVLLKPKETKSIYFTAQVQDDLNEDFEYSASLEAKDSFGNLASSNIFLGGDYEILSLKEINEKIKNLAKRETKIISTSLNLECQTEKERYYSDEEINIECKIKNNGNVLLKNINTCLKNKCNLIDLRIGEEEIINFVSNNAKEIEIITETDQIIRREKLDVEIIQVPDLFVSGITHQNVNYIEEIDFGFTLNSNFKAYNVNIKVNKRNIDIKDLEGSKDIILKLKGKNLVNGLNIKAVYYDIIGNKYEKDFSFEIKVEELPWYIKLLKIITFSD